MNLAIVDKIQKLLALGESPNQHEADLALSKAKALALEHDIDILKLQKETCETRKFKEESIEKSEKLKVAHHTAQKYIDPLIGVHFRVRTISMIDWRRKITGVIFIGKKTDLIIAEYVQAFLVGEFTRRFRAFMNERGNGAPDGYFAESFF